MFHLQIVQTCAAKQIHLNFYFGNNIFQFFIRWNLRNRCTKHRIFTLNSTNLFDMFHIEGKPSAHSKVKIQNYNNRLTLRSRCDVYKIFTFKLNIYRHFIYYINIQTICINKISRNTTVIVYPILFVKLITFRSK